MRFFVAVCVFGLTIGTAGWITNNWSAAFFARPNFHQAVASDSVSNKVSLADNGVQTAIVLPLTSLDSKDFPKQLAGETSIWK